jgi:hydrogenase expression/formation protein HypE
LLSDCRPLIDAVSILTGNQSDRHEVKFMRDATRGGVLGIISEIFENTNCNATVFSDRLPVSSEAAAVSKLLGVDPGFAACEGCLAAVVSAEYAEKCVEELHKITAFRKAAVIGEVSVGNGEVYMQSEWGSLRKLILPSGDQLPRIC